MKRSVNLETNLKSENSNCDAPASENSFNTNNCSKMCSVSIGGVQAKVKQHFCNIETDSLKVNKNLGVQNGSASCNLKYCGHQNGASNASSSSSSSLLSMSLSHSPPTNSTASAQKLMEKDGSEIDYYVRHNVDCLNTVDKCPSKVGNQSLENLQGVNGHSTNKVWNFRDDESSSGNEADETLSDHESCIYTYKGDQFADLPSSFFTLDLIANSSEQNGEIDQPQEVGEVERGESGSSPDMDFLEMDFDPGPSIEQDSEEDYDCYDSKAKVDGNSSPVPELPNEEITENDLSRNRNNDTELKFLTKSLENDLGISSNVLHHISPEPQPGPSNAYIPPDSPEKPTSLIYKRSIEGKCNKNSNSSNANSVTICNSSNNNNSNDNTNNSNSNHNGTMRFCWPARDSWGHHCTSGDLCSPTEIEPNDSPAFWSIGNLKIQDDLSPDTRKYNLQSALYHCIMAKRLVIDKKTVTDDTNSCFDIIKDVGNDANSIVDTTMIWSEQEACSKQITQISTSACGATAVINVMIAFNMKCSLDKVKESVATRLRAESAPIPEYLISRSFAGATHVDLIRGIHESSNGTLCARFFHMYPERDFSLSRWLSYWMKKGAVPIATLNLQQGVAPGNPIPDAWHHQMIFGISSRGIFLTNPLECVLEEALLSELCSPSVLKIKRSDIISRWNSGTDLRLLMNQEDPRWKEMNVLGQVVNIIRESTNTSVHGRVITQYISIPASYSSGITLVVAKDSPGYDELFSASELPEYPSQPD